MAPIVTAWGPETQDVTLRNAKRLLRFTLWRFTEPKGWRTRGRVAQEWIPAM